MAQKGKKPLPDDETDTVADIFRRMDEIEKEFKASVDDYIEWCMEDGVEPEKPYSGKFNVRFTPELHQQAAVGAKMLGISLNSFVEKSVKVR
ncbi:MAG: type II toxin-antitoxin system HicB family antitoxin [Lachnospiraceae bacterium]|nr:type II toxin-antitoxin system HicB family antitoxin [Lachnospiraceae bacterium]